MTLRQLLDDTQSPAARFFAARCHPAALSKLAVPSVPVSPEDEFCRMAFLYLTRWTFQPYYPVSTLAWLGAKRMGMTAEFAKLVWMGNFQPEQRAKIAWALATFEWAARYGDLWEPSASRQRFLDMKLHDSLSSYQSLYVHAPTFAGSSYVGGAHAAMLVDSTLVGISSSPQLDTLTLLMGIAHLVLDFDDALGITRLAFAFPFSGSAKIFSVKQLVKDLPGLRAAFRAEVPPVDRPYFDRDRVDELAFRNYEFQGFDNDENGLARSPDRAETPEETERLAV